MTSGRLEAFSDGVLAIIITIMVLELRPPEGSDLHSLGPMAPKLAAYLLSFVLVGIYWNNHHHLFFAVEIVDGRVLWANLHLLFWLSLIPFGTAWWGEHPTAHWPLALYGATLLGAGLAFFLLVRCLLAAHAADSALAMALGHDRKGTISVLVYAAAVPLALVSTWAALALHVAVAVGWFVPDKRISRSLEEQAADPDSIAGHNA